MVERTPDRRILFDPADLRRIAIGNELGEPDEMVTAMIGTVAQHDTSEPRGLAIPMDATDLLGRLNGVVVRYRHQQRQDMAIHLAANSDKYAACVTEASHASRIIDIIQSSRFLRPAQ